MATKRCKAVELSPMVNALIVGGNHHNARSYKGATDHNCVLAIQELVILIA
jgi:hypothetical protein